MTLTEPVPAKLTSTLELKKKYTKFKENPTKGFVA